MSKQVVLPLADPRRLAENPDHGARLIMRVCLTQASLVSWFRLYDSFLSSDSGSGVKMTLHVPLPLAIIVCTNLGGENGLLSRGVS